MAEIIQVVLDAFFGAAAEPAPPGDPAIVVDGPGAQADNEIVIEAG